MHNLYLIVGRTASGKDSLTRAVAEKYNLKILSSYTTRPKRPGETNEHIFIAPEDVFKYQDDIVAYTKIGEYEYFSTKQQLLESDVYIIDPKGVKYMKDKLKDIPDVDFHIIYISADYITRKHRALNNRKDREDVFELRCAAEESQFVDFECNQDWNKRIQNINFDKALLELETYIITNSNLEEI
jgi:guanylate kinase